MKYKYRNRQFYCRGYYVDTVEKHEIAIKKYIKNPLKDDIMLGQLTLDKIVQLLMVAGNNMQMASSNSIFN